MNLLKFAALVALVSVPFVFLRKESAAPPQVVESDNIFDEELASD